MGMFDWVNYEAPCPECGAILTQWQTKHTACNLDTVEPWEAKYFHNKCDSCGAWVEAVADAEVEHIVKRCDVTLRVEKRKP